MRPLILTILLLLVAASNAQAQTSISAEDAQRAAAVAEGCGVPAWVAGEVQVGPKRLIIEPLGVEFSGEDLQLR